MIAFATCRLGLVGNKMHLIFVENIFQLRQTPRYQVYATLNRTFFHQQILIQKNTMTNILDFLANPTCLLLFGLLFLLFVGIFLYFQGKINRGQRRPSLDSRNGYTCAEVKDYFDAIGAEGRDIYRFVVGRVDMVFPIVYGLLMLSAMAWLYRAYGGRFPILMGLFCLPVLTMLFDYLENFNTLRLLKSYPELVESEVKRASRITLIKRYLFIASLLTVILAGGACLFQ